MSNIKKLFITNILSGFILKQVNSIGCSECTSCLNGYIQCINMVCPYGCCTNPLSCCGAPTTVIDNTTITMPPIKNSNLWIIAAVLVPVFLAFIVINLVLCYFLNKKFKEKTNAVFKIKKFSNAKAKNKYTRDPTKINTISKTISVASEAYEDLNQYDENPDTVYDKIKTYDNQIDEENYLAPNEDINLEIDKGSSK